MPTEFRFPELKTKQQVLDKLIEIDNEINDISFQLQEASRKRNMSWAWYNEKKRLLKQTKAKRVACQNIMSTFKQAVREENISRSATFEYIFVEVVRDLFHPEDFAEVFDETHRRMKKLEGGR
jgi:hypothetical protein